MTDFEVECSSADGNHSSSESEYDWPPVIESSDEDARRNGNETSTNKIICKENYISNKVSYEQDGYVWLTKPPDAPATVSRRSSTEEQYGPSIVVNQKINRDDKVHNYWDLFISPDMLNLIVTFTNLYGSQTYGSSWQDTDVTEIRGLIGLLYIVGLQRRIRTTAQNLFSSLPGVGSPYASTVFSKQRFSQLLSAIHFDYHSARDENDTIRPINDFFEKFAKNCKISYVPGECITVGQSLVAFKGSCKFKTNFAAKPRNKCGIKIWCANDSDNFYLHNATISHVSEETLSDDVVFSLTSSLQNVGRTVSCNEGFTSITLAKKLYSARTYLDVSRTTRNRMFLCTFEESGKQIYDTLKHGLRNREFYSLLEESGRSENGDTTEYHNQSGGRFGNIRSNHVGIPEDFTNEKLDKDRYAILYSDNLSLLKLQSKNDEYCYVLSSKRHDCSSENPHCTDSPQIISDYKAFKGCVDTFNRLIDHFSCQLQSNCWPMRIFYWILDAAALNAFNIFWTKNSNEISKNKHSARTKFMSNLSTALMAPLQERRVASNHWYSVATRRMLDLMLEISTKMNGGERGLLETNSSQITERSSKRKRCHFCSKDKDRKTSYCCFECDKPICMEHQKMLCPYC